MEEETGEPLAHDGHESGPRFLAVDVFYHLNIKRGTSEHGRGSF